MSKNSKSILLILCLGVFHRFLWFCIIDSKLDDDSQSRSFHVNIRRRQGYVWFQQRRSISTGSRCLCHWLRWGLRSLTTRTYLNCVIPTKVRKCNLQVQDFITWHKCILIFYAHLTISQNVTLCTYIYVSCILLVPCIY